MHTLRFRYICWGNPSPHTLYPSIHPHIGNVLGNQHKYRDHHTCLGSRPIQWSSLHLQNQMCSSIHHRHHCRSHLVHCSCTHTSFACSLCHGNLVGICICCCCKRQLPHLPIPVCNGQCTFQFHNFCLSIHCSTRMYHYLCKLHVHHNLSSTVFVYKSLPQSLVCSSIHRRGNLNVGYLRIPYYRFVNCMRHLCSLWRRNTLASTWPFWTRFSQ